MQMRTLGSTDLKVSVLGYGGAPMGVLGADRQEISTLLNSLLDRGVNLIDTAPVYAGSEEVIGQSISSRRKEFVLVSKCPNPMTDGEDAWSAPKILASVDRSLQHLRTEQIDVVLLHSCGKDVLQKGEALGALMRAKEAGKIRFAGYSGDNETAAFAAGLPGISVIELSLSLCDQANLKSVIPVARQHSVGIIAKRPLANSAWRPLSEQKGFYVDYAKTYAERFAAMGLSLSDLQLKADAVQGWPEVALRFVLSQAGVHTAIVGTCQLAHAESNIRAAERGPLAENAVEAIRSAFARAEANSGQAWLAEL